MIQRPFPEFKGRAREWRRILPILIKRVGPLLDNVLPNWFAIIEEHYSLYIPYHNRLHIAYGLIWLTQMEATTDLLLAYLFHDANHNGIAKESPEETSADVACDYLHHDRLRPIILHTKFPYVENMIGSPDAWPQKKAASKDGGWLRLTDTFRPWVGGGAQELTSLTCATDFHLYLYESLGLWHEIRATDKSMTFRRWIEHGQAVFFPNQLIHATRAGAFGEEISVGKTERLIQSRQDTMKRMAGNRGLFTCLEKLERFHRNDVTLDEFVEQCVKYRI